MQVLIADDHKIVRKGVRSILESRSDLRICGEAKNGKQAVEKAGELRPDLIILDYSMPVMSGMAAANEIRQLMRTFRSLCFRCMTESRSLMHLD